MWCKILAQTFTEWPQLSNKLAFVMAMCEHFRAACIRRNWIAWLSIQPNSHTKHSRRRVRCDLDGPRLFDLYYFYCRFSWKLLTAQINIYCFMAITKLHSHGALDGDRDCSNQLRPKWHVHSVAFRRITVSFTNYIDAAQGTKRSLIDGDRIQIAVLVFG